MIKEVLSEILEAEERAAAINAKAALEAANIAGGRERRAEEAVKASRLRIKEYSDKKNAEAAKEAAVGAAGILERAKTDAVKIKEEYAGLTDKAAAKIFRQVTE